MNQLFDMPRRALDRVWRSRFARNVAVVATGTVAAQAITIAFAPLITRLYGPEAFGLLGTFMAIVAVATPLAALAYPIAIVLPRDDRDALGLVRLSGMLSLAIALLAAAALWAGGDWLAVTLGAQSVAGYMFLLPVAMIFTAWMQTAQQWLIRKKQFGVVARAAMAHSLIINSAKAGVGWLHPAGAVLITLATLGYALQAALLFVGARRGYQRSATSREQYPPNQLGRIAYRFRDFALYRAPQNFINAASRGLPVLMLAAFFGPAAAGFYTLGMTVLGVPSSLVGKAVSDVFYPRISEAAQNGDNLYRLILRATGALLVIGIVPFGLVVLFGPWLFGLVFGSDWIASGEYARWLALWLLVGFINRPSVAAIPVLSIQRGFLVYEIFSVIVRAAAIVLGVLLYQRDDIAVALYASAGVCLNLFLIAWVLRIAHRHRSRASAPMTRPDGGSLP